MDTFGNARYDVVVVGGGPAGSTAATLLAQRGRDVLVLEREQFPRYHVGESLISGIVPVIRELGLEEVMDETFQLKFGVTLKWGNDPTPWRTQFDQASPYTHSWHVDRASFDDVLLQNARNHGVTVLENARVTDVHSDESGAVTGLTYKRDGRDFHVQSKYVVDASGQSRTVTRQLTDVDWVDLLKNVATWRYFDNFTSLENSQDILIESVPSVGGWLWAIPISEERLSVGYVAAADDLAEAKAAGRSNAELFDAALAVSTEAKTMVAKAIPVAGQRTARDYSHIAKKFAGKGWIAVGDTAAFIDPLFSSGVWLGMSGAWLAARALDSCLDDSSLAPTALLQYDKVYRQIAEDILAYVEYFSNPHREVEDYLQKANAAAETFAAGSQLGFVSLISGVTALPSVLNFDPLGDNGFREAYAGAVSA
ncbi:NAD(P)/FAD-dependent oxidoreductase [Actinomycetes bacterium M1A6_2h]